MEKTFNINGSIYNGQIRMRLIRSGAAVAVYWPAGMEVDAPTVLTGNLREQCDAIKARYGLTPA